MEFRICCPNSFWSPSREEGVRQAALARGYRMGKPERLLWRSILACWRGNIDGREDSDGAG